MGGRIRPKILTYTVYDEVDVSRMKILKFGGSSVGSAARIRDVIAIVSTAVASEPVHVVVSAFQGVTDQLLELGMRASSGDIGYVTVLEQIERRHIEAIKELIPVQQQSGVLAQFKFTFNELEDILNGVYLVREASVRTLDVIVSFGERFSAFIIASALSAAGTPSAFADARQFIRTDSTFGNARIDHATTVEQIKTFVARQPGVVQVITGFIASTEKGETTTLGRGGSDFTASIVGAALDVTEIQIWTDVDGVLTADPRKVKRAFPLAQMTYEEAMEMSHFGAKVIYPPTMQPALVKGIPLRIKNTFNPSAEGTLISRDHGTYDAPIRGISSISDIALISITGPGMVGVTGVAGRIFETLASAAINVILITQASSEHTVCLAVLPIQADDARKHLEHAFRHEIRDGLVNQVVVERELAIVAIVGENMRRTPGIAGRIFQALGKNGINIVAIAQGSSELNISVVISKSDEAKALNALHDAFFLSGLKTLNIYLVGTGLIGSTFLDLLDKQRQTLLDTYFIDLHIVGVANSRKMVVDADGILIPDVKSRLESAQEASDLAAFVKHMQVLNLPNSVFVDCTATEAVPSVYEHVLKSSISIITPNKKANSGPMARYRELGQLAQRHNVQFLYETNVGAGLPVINTLRSMVTTGDRIHQIEGVLSGTLSFLFNTYDGSVPFSELLRQARDMGYTEPDPRDDLNGHDVGRKLLILAREAGNELEFSDLEIENLVPEAARSAPDVDSFFEKLKAFDDDFLRRYKNASNAGNVLRYIARFADGKGVVNLQEVGSDHPFYNLQATDNIVAFNSDHYHNRPMVVKGPGAGAFVTASGVIADLLRVAQSAR